MVISGSWRVGRQADYRPGAGIVELMARELSRDAICPSTSPVD
jgi:hypothetical protein